MRKFLAAGLIGGIIAYFLDPNKGSKRRNNAAGALGGASKRFGGQSQSASSQGSNQTSSTSQSSSTGQSSSSQSSKGSSNSGQSTVQERVSAPRDNPNPDDNTLKDRVESEIFADTETSREHINIDVIQGVAIVRGELPQDEIDALIPRIKAIPDVKGVTSYLHTPGTPAPNKESALEAS